MILPAYLPQDRRHALAQNRTLPDCSSGSTLFADISGFTPLAEALTQSLGAQRGAEELTRQLNHIYDALISQVHRYRGSVIGFSGDAITCWFDEQDGQSALRAAQCALSMQAAMRAFSQVAIRVGIALGSVRRFVVGDPHIQWIDALTGAPLHQMAQAQTIADKGEIVLAPSAVRALAGCMQPIRRVDDFVVLGGLMVEVAPSPWDDLPEQALTQEQLRPWVLPALYDSIRSETEQFITELRAVTALFVQFNGIEYDTDGDAGEKLDGYIRHVQHIVNRYEGSLLQLTIGDKGSFFYAVFGAPIAHDDDPIRAVQAALELNSHPAPVAGITMQIGIATGQMRVGAYGSRLRRTYGAIGDATNLAARLMQAAPVGGIRCDYNAYHAARKRLAFELMPPIRVKGKAGLVRVYKPTRSQPSEMGGSSSEMVGRHAEMAAIEKMLDEVQGGATRVLQIEGEAGIGKSRLANEVIRLARERGLVILPGNGQSIEQQTPYRAWRDVFTAYFGTDELTDVQERRAQVEAVAAQLIPEHLLRLPVLNDVLGLEIPENDLTQTLDAKLRQQNVTLVLTALLRAWTREHPLVLILDDAHWLDELSWELALQFVRVLSISNEPLLFVLVNRPLDENSAGQKVFSELRGLNITQALALSVLASDEIVALIAKRLNVRADTLPVALVELVQARANGNPFFAEELVFNLRDTGAIQVPEISETTKNPVFIVGDLETAQHALPNTLHGLILSRIDRLPPERQFVVKVAAVIGRAFAFAPLLHVLARYVTIVDEALKEHLKLLTRADFTFLEMLEPELTYLFKHIITQEAAYQTLLFEQRRELHRHIAEWYENQLVDERGTTKDGKILLRRASLVFPLLAYHYRYAEDTEKEIQYLKLAGEAAEKVYANDAALGFHTRLLTLIAPGEQIEFRLKRGAVLELIGRWAEAEADYRAALEPSGQDGAAKASAQFSLGRLYRKRGETETALEWLAQARDGRTAMNDGIGLAQTLIEISSAFESKDEYARAWALCEEGLALARELDDKRDIVTALNLLGILCYDQGDIAAAQVWFERNLAFARELDDRRNVAMTLNNLGVLAVDLDDYDTGLARYEEALAAFRELGDKRSVGVLLANLGALASTRGDHAAARAQYGESLALKRELGNKRNIAATLNELGMVVFAENDYANARALLSESLSLGQSIGDMESVSYSLVRLANVALVQPASVSLDEQRVSALRAASLTGAAKALLEASGAAVDSEFPHIYERAVTAARSQLGEEDFEAASALGARWTVEQAVDEALKNP